MIINLEKKKEHTRARAHTLAHMSDHNQLTKTVCDNDQPRLKWPHIYININL